MTPETIIDENWKLRWYGVAKVAFMDDLILLVKMWPFWVVLIVFGTLYNFWPRKNLSRKVLQKVE